MSYLSNEILLLENRRKIYNFIQNNPGFNLRKISRKLKLKITKYKASEGDEYFLQFINFQ